MAIVQWKLGGFLSETSVMKSEPQDDYKRNNKFGAVQVITDVAIGSCASVRPLTFYKFLATVCTNISSACPNTHMQRAN